MTDKTEMSPKLMPEKTDQAFVRAIELRKEKSMLLRKFCALRYTRDSSRSHSNGLWRAELAVSCAGCDERGPAPLLRAGVVVRVLSLLGKGDSWSLNMLLIGLNMTLTVSSSLLTGVGRGQSWRSAKASVAVEAEAVLGA